MIRLLGYGAHLLGIQEFIQIEKNLEKKELFGQLLEVYETLRFVEDAGFLIANKNIILELDETTFNLESIFSKKLGESKSPKIYVYETLKNRFLKFNDFFTEDMITNNREGEDNQAPELIGDSAWKHFMVTDLSARDVSNNVEWSFTPRLSKQE